MGAKHGCTTRNSISFTLTNDRLININVFLIEALKRPSCLPGDRCFFYVRAVLPYILLLVFIFFLFNTDFVITGKLQQGR